MATGNKLMTADELWRMPDDGQRHELIAGDLRTMPPSGWERGWIVVRVTRPLAQHVDANKLGVVCGAETGFILTREPDTVRAADVAFVRRERVLAAGDVKSYWPGAPRPGGRGDLAARPLHGGRCEGRRVADARDADAAGGRPASTGSRRASTAAGRARADRE